MLQQSILYILRQFPAVSAYFIAIPYIYWNQASMLYALHQKNGKNIVKLYLYTYLTRKNQKNFKQQKI